MSDHNPDAKHWTDDDPTGKRAMSESKVVPVKPTDVMIRNGVDRYFQVIKQSYTISRLVQEIYSDMLASAPAEPVAEGTAKQLADLEQEWNRARAVDGTKHHECMHMVQMGDRMLAALKHWLPKVTKEMAEPVAADVQRQGYKIAIDAPSDATMHWFNMWRVSTEKKKLLRAELAAKDAELNVAMDNFYKVVTRAEAAESKLAEALEQEATLRGMLPKYINRAADAERKLADREALLASATMQGTSLLNELHVANAKLAAKHEELQCLRSQLAERQQGKAE